MLFNTSSWGIDWILEAITMLRGAKFNLSFAYWSNFSGKTEKNLRKISVKSL